MGFGVVVVDVVVVVVNVVDVVVVVGAVLVCNKLVHSHEDKKCRD